MATEDYVPVAADDWYQRRRDDVEGQFFRAVADQGPRKGAGGSTRQGIYCPTADGTLLAYKNAGQAPDVMRDVLRQGLRAWRQLSTERRQPGAVAVAGADTTDARFTRTPPPGGLIVTVYARILDHEKGASQLDAFCRGRCSVRGAEAAARDHLWLTKAEWEALVPSDPKAGEGVPVPAAVAERILRFHLTDNTRGEPPMWRRKDIRRQELTLTVEEATPAATRLRLDGSALLSTGADLDEADRGFDVRLLGYIGYDRAARAIDRFDVVAVGDHWGRGPHTGRARPGRTPLGVAFVLANGKAAADLAPPQAIRDPDTYFGRGR
jgi:hypothetical protein